MTFRGEKHAQAWTWLNEQDVDVALLQGTVPPEKLGTWDSVVFQRKYPGKDWGCAVLVREGAYEQWSRKTPCRGSDAWAARSPSPDPRRPGPLVCECPLGLL